MNILLTGGGTGGHVIPNIALIPYLKRQGANIYYIGSRDSIEERLISEQNVPFYPVTTVKLRRDKILGNLTIPHLLLRGIREAKEVLSTLNIDVVFAKGGYVSLPAAYAAKSLNIPVICHESDASLGMANKLISRYARITITSYENTRVRGNTKCLGNPIRDSIFDGDASHVIDTLDYDSTLPFLLIVGGSQGAQRINNFVTDNVSALTERYNIIHLTGRNVNKINHSRYNAIEYASNIEDYLALADIVVSRSGANALAELTALRKKTILIPLETRASRGDQLSNALIAESQHRAIVLREHDLTLDTFEQTIARVTHMSIPHSDYVNASERIANLIVTTAEEHALLSRMNTHPAIS